MPDQMITRGVAVGGVQPMQASTGRNYWVVTDDQGQEWRCFDAATAMAANGLQGQMALMKVAITPAKDPQFGMNYYLRAISAAPDGAQPTGPQPLMQPMQQPTQPAQMMMPTQPQMTPITPPTGQQLPQMPQSQALPEGMPENLRPPVKTMGQGGNMTDADLTRMARSTAISAVIAAAFRFEDFRDEELNADWERIYAVAEAATKFILFRRHEGWQPGEEITPSSNEQAVLAEVHDQFPGTTEQQPQLTTDDDDSDIPWGE